MRLKCTLLFILLSYCNPTLERSPLEFISFLQVYSRTSSFSISYSGSPFTLTQNIRFNPIIPTISGNINTCSSNPSLPDGLSIDSSTCTISGTPISIQNATIYTITASNSSASRSTEISIAVTQAAPSNLVYANSPFTFAENVTIIDEIPTITGTPSSCSSSPSLPAGLSISNSCVISGTPSALQAATNYTITASNSFGSTTATISISINSAIFQFNFATGSLLESFGSGLTFTAVGAPSFSIGKDGDTDGAFRFNGTSQYLTISNPAGLPSGASDRTYCAWVNPSSTPNNSVFLSQGTATTDSGMGLTLNVTFPSTDISIWSWGTTVSVAYTPRINTWQHICGTLSGTTANIYVDGVLVGTGTLSNVNTSLAVLNVGANINFGNMFGGKIDDVRIYRYALTAEQIRQIAIQVPNNLLARYDFNGNPTDSSGNNNNLTSVGTPALVNDRNGTATSAYRFNGTTRFNTSSPVTTVTSNITLSAWFRPTAYNAGLNYIVANGTGANGYGILIDQGDGNRIKGILGGTGYINSTVVPALNVWSHVALVSTGTSWVLRLNGVSIGTLIGTPGIPTSGTYIGSDGATGFFTGDIDDVRVYSLAISNQAITALSGYHPMQVATWTSNPVSSSLKIHLQADSLTNLPDGSPVSSWNDNSGNGNTVTAGTSPTYLANGLNSKPSVRFVRTSNQFLSRVAGVGLNGNTFSTFGVFNPSPAPAAPQFLTLYSISTVCGQDKVVRIMDTNLIEAGVCNVLSVDPLTDPVASGNNYLFGFNYTINVSSSVFLNGKLLTTEVAPPTAIALPNTNFAVGRRQVTVPVGNSSYDGLISEILYFDGAFSNASRNLVQCYLSSKYNIPLDPIVICP